MNPLWELTLENMTNHSPDTEILGYISSTFTREYQADLINALAILYNLEFPDIQEKLLGLINGVEAEDNEGLSELVSQTISDSLDQVFVQWGITLTEDVMLSIKNSIATALTFVTSIEDPVPYLRILETDLSKQEKLARIVYDLTNVSEIAVLDAVLDISDSAIQRLYGELTKREQAFAEVEEISVNEKQLKNFQLFCQYAGKEHIGYQMLMNNFKLGMPAETYYTYVHNYLDVDVPVMTADNILSYYLMASDTWEAPMDAFRSNSERLLTNSRDILTVESAMRKRLEGFEQYKRALHDPS